MTRPDRRLFLTGLCAGLLGGCGPSIGDLADRRPPAEGGIGGTGIVGVVTGLGSLHVGGRRVRIAPDAALSDATGTIAAANIQPGHSVTIEAATDREGLIARRVRLTHPLIGRLEVAANGTLSVLGVPLRTEPGLVIEARAGARVAISGLWRGRRVVVSRIDVLAGDGPASVSGDVIRMADGAFAIGSVRLTEAPNPALAIGSFATALGEEVPEGLNSTLIEPGRFFGSAGPLESLVIEGYLERVPSAPGFAVSGLGHSFDPEAQLGALANDRTLFQGPYVGTFAVARALRLPDDAVSRSALLDPAARAAREMEEISTR